jgi:uncharacterized protein (TIGR02147 family)
MNVYGYMDYREFIRDSVDQLRSRYKITNRGISKKVGVKSPSYYKETVVDGTKNMSVEVARKFAKMLQLNNKETGYLAALTELGLAKTEYEKSLALEKVLRLRKRSTVDSHFLEINEYTYTYSWRYTVIREMLPLLSGFGNRSAEERTEMAKLLRPDITDKQIDEAIRLLESMKFVRKDRNGNYVKKDNIIRGENTPRIAHTALCQLVDIGKTVINQVDPESRRFKTLVLNVTKEICDMVQNKIDDFCHEILDLASKDGENGDRIYTMNIQFYPLTKFPEK